MKEEKDYIQDIVEIRTMMERSTKFLSLSGLSGVLAGIYALIGVYFAIKIIGFNPDSIQYTHEKFQQIILVALIVMVGAIGTAIVLSISKANKTGEKFWNASAKRLVVNMAVPLIAGGIILLMLMSYKLIGLIAPFSLLFYGLALYNASKFTYENVKSLAIIEICLGLLSAYFISYSLLIWAIGFGIVHIVYGIYIYYKFEK